jgi:hypothetical protein
MSQHDEAFHALNGSEPRTQALDRSEVDGAVFGERGDRCRAESAEIECHFNYLLVFFDGR